MKRISTARGSAKTLEAISFITASSLWVGTQGLSKLQSTFPTSAHFRLPFGIFCLVRWDTHLFPTSTQPISPEVLSPFISLLGLCWAYPPSDPDVGHILYLSHLLISPASPNAEGRCWVLIFSSCHTPYFPLAPHTHLQVIRSMPVCVCAHFGGSEAGGQGQEWKTRWGD